MIKNMYEAINKFLTELCYELIDKGLITGVKGIQGIRGESIWGSKERSR